MPKSAASPSCYAQATVWRAKPYGKTPLKGPSQDRVGFYTWGCTLTIEKLTVYRKS